MIRLRHVTHVIRKYRFDSVQRSFLHSTSYCRMAEEIKSKTIFVSETGQDNNPGTEAAPCKTIIAALFTGGENVRIHIGINYVITSTFIRRLLWSKIKMENGSKQQNLK